MHTLTGNSFSETEDVGKTSELGSSLSSLPHCGKKPNKN
jgi:hypothetical protein